MGYYMGDASAARHQGGLFSFAVRAVGKIARTFIPPQISAIAQLGRSLIPRTPTMPSIGSGQFSPSTPPGVAPLPSSAPLVIPVSAPPQLRTGGLDKAVAGSRAPKRLTRRPARRLTAAQQARQRSNAALRARLRSRGYRV